MFRVRILVIDDDPEEASAIARALDGYDVAIVDRAIDGLHAMAARHFDVVVAGVELTGMDGVALQRAAAARGLPVSRRFLFTTAAPASAAVRRAMSETTSPIFPKPLDRDLLRATVERLANPDYER